MCYLVKLGNFLKPKKLWYWIALVSVEIDQKPKALSLIYELIYDPLQTNLAYDVRWFSDFSLPQRLSFLDFEGFQFGDDSINESFNFK